MKDYYGTCPACGETEFVRPATPARDWWLYCLLCNNNARLTPDGPDDTTSDEYLERHGFIRTEYGHRSP